MLPVRLEDFRGPSLAVNLGLIAALLLSVKRYWKALYADLSSRSFLASFWLVAILLSSFIPAMAVWVNLVYWPTAWLSRGVEWLFFLGEPPARSASSEPPVCPSRSPRTSTSSSCRRLHRGVLLARPSARPPSPAFSR
jgi:hypothetical protein